MRGGDFGGGLPEQSRMPTAECRCVFPAKLRAYKPEGPQVARMLILSTKPNVAGEQGENAEESTDVTDQGIVGDLLGDSPVLAAMTVKEREKMKNILKKQLNLNLSHSPCKNNTNKSQH